MTRIYVEFAKLDELKKGLADNASKVDKTKRSLDATVRKLDWDVRLEEDINNIAAKLGIRMLQHKTALDKCKAFLQDAIKQYKDLDQEKVEWNKVLNPRSDMFDGTNGYGGDQGSLKSPKNNGWWGLGHNKEVYAFVRQQEGYEKLTDYEISKLLNKMNKEGCGYIGIVNTLFAEFPGTEADFERIYGFPMKNDKGEYNYDKMFIELYCMTDDRYDISTDSGIDALRSRCNPEEFQTQYGVAHDAPYDEIREAIFRENSSGIVTRRHDSGTTPFEQKDRLETYLINKEIDADVDYNIVNDMSVDDIKSSLEKGKVVTISVGEGATFYDDQGIYQTIDGNHRVAIIDVLDDGRYVVSSWGKKLYVDPSQISATTNENITNNYSCINIDYKL